MNDNLYQCTAKKLATTDPETVSSSTTVGEAYEWFDAKGYDYAPVVDDNKPVGYIGLKMLTEEPDERPVKRVMGEITLERIISPDSLFNEIIMALKEKFFYLLGGRNQITGIITRADLNTSPVRIHLFDRISLLERQLRELIDEQALDWEQEVYLPNGMIKKVEKNYQKAQKANVELSKIHYTGFAALKNIITYYETCWRACGYEKAHQAGSDLSNIKDLRNDVAHSNLILQTTSDEYNTEGRSIRELIKVYDALMHCNHSLQIRGE